MSNSTQVRPYTLAEVAALQCPVCGYYCVGNGGIGCIDKKGLYEITQRASITPEPKQ